MEEPTASDGNALRRHVFSGHVTVLVPQSAELFPEIEPHRGSAARLLCFAVSSFGSRCRSKSSHSSTE